MMTDEQLVQFVVEIANGTLSAFDNPWTTKRVLKEIKNPSRKAGWIVLIDDFDAIDEFKKRWKDFPFHVRLGIFLLGVASNINDPMGLTEGSGGGDCDDFDDRKEYNYDC